MNTALVEGATALSPPRPDPCLCVPAFAGMTGLSSAYGAQFPRATPLDSHFASS
jgi:hypothetical protein